MPSPNTPTEFEGDVITVTWGRELLQGPIAYRSFEVGPFSMSTTIRRDETPGQAYERVYAWLDAIARTEYERKVADHQTRVQDAARARP